MIQVLALLAKSIYLSKKAQFGALIAEKTTTKILAEYLNFTNMFSSNLVMELPKNIKINNYAINNIKEKQLFYGAIYNLGQVNMKSLKTYIKIYLRTNFIYFFKFLADIPILFNQKQN